MNIAGRWALAAVLLGAGLWVGGCQTSPRVLRDRGIAAYRQNDLAAARENLERAHDGHAADWKTNFYLGKIALDRDDADAARTYLEVAYTLQPKGPPDQPRTPEIVDLLTEAICRQGDYPRMINFCNEAIRQYGTMHDYLRKARYLERIGDHDQALVAYRTAIRVTDGRRPEPWVALADFYDAIGDSESALIQLRHAYAVDPGNPQIAERLRSHSVVPGPTIALPPDDAAPGP
jgi:tetratricopeptide (TPR) repeat protein